MTGYQFAAALALSQVTGLKIKGCTQIVYIIHIGYPLIIVGILQYEIDSICLQFYQ